jgi:hypothetical protein
MIVCFDLFCLFQQSYNVIDDTDDDDDNTIATRGNVHSDCDNDLLIDQVYVCNFLSYHRLFLFNADSKIE